MSLWELNCQGTYKRISNGPFLPWKYTLQYLRIILWTSTFQAIKSAASNAKLHYPETLCFYQYKQINCSKPLTFLSTKKLNNSKQDSHMDQIRTSRSFLE